MGVDFITIPNLFSDLSELFTEMTVASITMDVSKYSPLVDPDIFTVIPSITLQDWTITVLLGQVKCRKV